MFIDTVNAISRDNVRQLESENIRLIAIKTPHYADEFEELEPGEQGPPKKKLKWVDMQVAVAFELYDGTGLALEMPDLLPPEWVPSISKRLAYNKLMAMDLTKTWLALAPEQRISAVINKLGQVNIRGLRTPAKYEPLEEIRIEVQLPVYLSHVVINVRDRDQPIGTFYEVKW